MQGLYVNGSSGECIYQSVADRKLILEEVMAVAKGKLTIIAHVACNNTKDSVELARHAEELGVDAIAAIPPIYFRLPEYSVAHYWNEISAAAPNTDFVIYNTCTVRENANTRVYGRLGQLKPLKKKNPHMMIGLCGCMMQEPEVVEKLKKGYRFVTSLGTHNIFKVLREI
mgnify:CR=1 FL=1